MMDLRYHVVSLTAVFLALAVGIVVGSSLGGTERQTAIVERLQENLDRVMEEDLRVQAENEALRRRLAAREEAERRLMPNVIQDRLTGMSLAILVCGDGFSAEARAALREALALAGAEVTSTTRLPERLGPIPDALRPALASGGTNGALETEERIITRAVTRAVLSGNAGGRLEELARGTGVTLEGEYDTAAPRLLIVAAPQPHPEFGVETYSVASSVERLALEVLDLARGFGAQVLAAEPEESEDTALLQRAKLLRLTTIDNIDTASGQIALVLALAGGTRGSFGSKPSASQPIPPP